MPPLTDAIINQWPLPNSNLEQRVRYLENTVEPIRRGFYGDISNHVPGIANEVHAMKEQLDRMYRHAIYWRMVQSVLFVVLAAMLLGVLFK